MNSPSPSKYPNRDGLPLSQLSPERVNGRIAKMDDLTKPTTPIAFSSPLRRKPDESTSFFNPGIALSPSLPEISSIRVNTDVSGLVKRFEHLDVRDREAENQERKRKQDEALNRAKIAREEAETESRRCREELRAQKKEYEECKARERKACRRIEILMDESTRAKDQWSSQLSVYEKEVRRARKEAFKSSSAVLKLQEETKQSQSEANVLKSKLDLADRKAARSEEDKFTAQYQLVAVQEELERLRSTLRIAEEERDRWKRSLQEEDVIRIASQGSIALPHDDVDMTEAETQDPSNDGAAIHKMSLVEVRSQMLLEKRRRYAAEGLVDFLQLECQFRCCKCVAEHGKPSAVLRSRSPHVASRDRHSPAQADEHAFQPAMLRAEPAKLVEDHEPPSMSKEELPEQRMDEVPQSEHDQDAERSHLENQRLQTPNLDTPSSRDPGSWREVSKTTTIPMHFTPSVKQHVQQEDAATPIQPSTEAQQDPKTYPFDREAALAAIAYRRGRAKSFAQSNGTPKRPVIERINDRRDISAPAVTG